MSMTMVLAPDSPGTSAASSFGRQVREARLRPEFAELYPGLRAGEWVSAAVVADRVLADALLRGTEMAIRGRVLLAAHFEFRGGGSQGGERDGVRVM
jgi:hypothetical protein